MKRLECILRPERFEDVHAALGDLGIVGMTAGEVRGCAIQRGYRDRRVDDDRGPRLVPKLKLEIVLADEQVEPAIAAIIESARTGEVGDGKIFIFPVQGAVRIRTGERDESAV